MVDDLITLSLPFLLSIVIKVLSHGVRGYAERLARTALKDGNLSQPVADFAVDVAAQTYLHLSFVFSLVMSSISSMAYTILSPRPILAAAGAIPLLVLFPWWILRWQGLSPQEVQGRAGRSMRLSSWAVIFGLWAVTLFSKLVLPTES